VYHCNKLKSQVDSLTKRVFMLVYEKNFRFHQEHAVVKIFSFVCLIVSLVVVLFFKDSISSQQYLFFQILLGFGVLLWGVELIIFFLKFKKTSK